MKQSLKRQIRLLKEGRVGEAEFLKYLESIPYHDLGDVKLDFHRPFRRGLPEVVYGKDKTTAQLLKIVKAFREVEEPILVTRVTPDKVRRLRREIDGLVYHETAAILTFEQKPEVRYKTPLLVLSAGASDEPVAEEAYVSARYLGNEVEKAYDVGVACISRILDLRGQLNRYAVVIVVAGMEGALPSVVAGLTATPIIAVPTSIGYGASFSGLAALLSMLNSCSGGVSVVNIDNGFGAAYQATLINQKLHGLRSD